MAEETKIQSRDSVILLLLFGRNIPVLLGRRRDLRRRLLQGRRLIRGGGGING